MNLLYNGNCEELLGSKVLRREFRRIIHTVTKDVNSDLNYKIHSEIFSINLAFISSVENQGYRDRIEQRVVSLLAFFLNKLKISETNFRVNIKVKTAVIFIQLEGIL